jgi:hypothetical protein
MSTTPPTTGHLYCVVAYRRGKRPVAVCANSLKEVDAMQSMAVSLGRGCFYEGYDYDLDARPYTERHYWMVFAGVRDKLFARADRMLSGVAEGA